VSAAIAPKASGEAPEPAGGDDEGWALLENLRRRLEDQAAQARRTQQQVSQLAESIGALVEVQRRRSRWLNLNSFVAYLIFTMLCGAGFYLLYENRAGALSRALDAAERDRELAVRGADEASARTAARAQADDRAWEVYQLLEAGKRVEAEGKLAALRDLPLSRTERALLAARAHEVQVMAVAAALKAAAASFKAGRHAEVIAPLEAALVSEPAGERAVLMRYYLGVAYAKASQLEKAIAHLEAAVGGNTDQEDARFQLASALDRSGAYARARVEYDGFATARPQSPLALFAMRRSATLARMPPVAPARAAPGARGPAAPAAIPAPKPAVPAPQVVPAPKPPAPGPQVVPAPKPPAPAPAPPSAEPAPPPSTPPQAPGTPPAAP
jgi:tetratricopeptide (TPR) repeat protein